MNKFFFRVLLYRIKPERNAPRRKIWKELPIDFQSPIQPFYNVQMSDCRIVQYALFVEFELYYLYRTLLSLVDTLKYKTISFRLTFELR